MCKFRSLNNNNSLSTLSKAFLASRKAVKVDFPCNFLFIMIVVKTKRCSEHDLPCLNPFCINHFPPYMILFYYLRCMCKFCRLLIEVQYLCTVKVGVGLWLIP